MLSDFLMISTDFVMKLRPTDCNMLQHDVRPDKGRSRWEPALLSYMAVAWLTQAAFAFPCKAACLSL